MTMIISFWVAGIPLAYFFGFIKEMGLKGMYLSFFLALTMAAAVLIIVSFFWIDYKYEAVEAKQRNDRAARELASRDATSQGEVSEYRDNPGSGC